MDTRSTQSDAPEITAEEFSEILLFENERALFVDKPGWLVCHPTKAGPGSSLIGAAKRYLKCERLHLVSRLDRETSGIVVFAKDRGAARFLQMAVEHRKVNKSYLAILEGNLEEELSVEGDLCPARESPVRVKMKVRSDAPKFLKNPVLTRFEPIQHKNGKTLCKVTTKGGRKHQIRVHALHCGFPLLGDKLYGKDETLYIEFCTEGWTQRLEQNLSFHRQALHCSNWSVENNLNISPILSPLPEDMAGLFI